MLDLSSVYGQQNLNLMPWPASIKNSDGNYRLNQSFKIYVKGPESKSTLEYSSRFLERLANRSGIFFTNYTPKVGSTNNGLQITYQEVVDLELGIDESYSLEISASGINLISKTQIGVIRGLETLLQLLSSDNRGYFFNGRNIEDEPRFVWRGLLLDVCSHWMPMEVLTRNIDAMAAVKMNVLHLHLTEDQGFRIESKRFPKLHQMGSDGNYFSQEDIRYIVRYASDRGIRVVPEFDIPGHTTSWFVGYPELASAPGPYDIMRTFGVHNPTMDPTKESTYKFLDEFLTEMSGLFPDEYLHIGGDENNGKQWDASKEITKFKEDNYLDNNHELQAYFNGRISKILDRLGKRMVGWDEIAHENL
ncbi:MAG: beta-N-acetylhexosaminidase, partial [Candidatus Heimdallarchaeota archaeon]